MEGTVTTLDNKPGEKGPSTYLVGDYQIERGAHRFSVVWAASDWRDRAWVPPDGTPPVGAKVLLHTDPSNLAHVALVSSPTKRSAAHDVVLLAVIVLSLPAGAIAVWFI